MNMLKVVLLQTLFIYAAAGEVKCPDDIVYCNSGYTCCLISAKEYGCCPLPNAVCCKDHIHCCPHGFGCDLATTSCFQRAENGSKIVIDMVLKSYGKPIKEDTRGILDSRKSAGDFACPDKVSFCPTGTTCCLMDCGRYGCCQYDNAVCCKDHIHCCPHDYRCDIPYCTPLKQYLEMPMKKLAKNDDNGSYLAVIFHTCEDRKSQCSDGERCCPLKGGGYDCCAYSHGKCCSDGLHCCPRGFTCDLTNKKCTKKLEKLPMIRKIEAKAIRISDKLCPDNRTKCKDNETCCDDVGGGSFCCQFPEAVCCPKTKRCCPKGFVCEPGAGLCNKRSPPGPLKDKPLVVKCPDQVSTCPDNNTCCRTRGGYGCCPLVNAVCCNDHKHCCPAGYRCSTDQGYCTKGEKKLLVGKPINALSSNVQDKYICPDKESTCFVGETCCLLQSHGYGCCPLPNAVCCDDREHCCPHGYQCWSGFCTRGSEKIPGYKNSRSLSGKVICPDGLSECDEGSSCCKISRSGYGCCPLPHAVCCGDYKHCCPKGFKCTKEGYCVSGFVKIPAQLFSKAALHNQRLDNKALQIGPSLPSENQLFRHGKLINEETRFLSPRDRLLRGILRHELQVCGNGMLRCKLYETCCPTPRGYSCCPFYNAVCCQHSCCPSSSKCMQDDCQSYLSSSESIRFVP